MLDAVAWGLAGVGCERAHERASHLSVRAWSHGVTWEAYRTVGITVQKANKRLDFSLSLPRSVRCLRLSSVRGQSAQAGPGTLSTVEVSLLNMIAERSTEQRSVKEY